MTAPIPPLPTSLVDFLQNTSMRHFLPSDPEFLAIKLPYVATRAVPSVVIRPKDAAQVQQLVACCVFHGVEFVVRSGGHDLRGRSTVDGVVQIDMRDVNHVTVDNDAKTARVGGGVLFGHLLEELQKRDAMAAVGTIDTVGLVGWSTLGGYGPYSPSFGLGVDQILGATVVNAKGELITADERLLTALRGGGASSFGVVVELEIKVYPLRQIQSGTLIYESSNISKTMTDFFAAFKALTSKDPLPPHIYVQPIICGVPGMGKALMLSWVWSGGPETHDEASVWLEKIAGLAPCIQRATSTTTPRAAMAALTAMFPPGVQGACHSVSLSDYSTDSVGRLSQAVSEMRADGASALILHSLTSNSPSTYEAAVSKRSVFRNRGSHLLVEIIGCGRTEEAADAASRWAEAARQNLDDADTALEGTYPAMSGMDDVRLEKTYGPHAEYLRILKKEVDSDLVFKHSTPNISVL